MFKVAVRLRIRPPRRRTPLQRLKTRLYYRRNKAKIRLQRKRYQRKWKAVLKRRRLFQRYKPGWLKHSPKPKHTFKKPHKFKIKVHKFFHPKHIRPKKFHPHHFS